MTCRNVGGFDIVRRFDGSYAVYDFGWHPDDELDSNPEANALWLEGTQGWRAKSWQVVHVTFDKDAAYRWCINMSERN